MPSGEVANYSRPIPLTQATNRLLKRHGSASRACLTKLVFRKSLAASLRGIGFGRADDAGYER